MKNQNMNDELKYLNVELFMKSKNPKIRKLAAIIRKRREIKSDCNRYYDDEIRYIDHYWSDFFRSME